MGQVYLKSVDGSESERRFVVQELYGGTENNIQVSIRKLTRSLDLTENV